VPEAPEADAASSLVGTQGRRFAGVIVAVVAPVTLITALAYYFGYRREQAFAGYFGIDPSALGFTTNDYVLRSVDALFVPITVVLLVAFAAVFLHALAGDRFERVNLGPVAAVVGLCALILGIVLLAGKPLAHDYAYLQALAPAVGVMLLIYALSRSRSVGRHGLGAAVFVGIAVVLVSLFWATSDYADSRGRAEARQLARDVTVRPSATIFSKENLDIHPLAAGGGVEQGVEHGGGCPLIMVQKFHTGAYPFAYSGFTLLLQSGGNFFLTPTPSKPNTPWDPETQAVFVVPNASNVRVQFTRGVDYVVNPGEALSKPQLTFTC
jgi:uncharacterized membrane protein YjfL (UPF0719 family)